MADLILTDDEIKQEVRQFEDRINAAQAKLSVLPTGAATWKERKRLDKLRREIRAGIKHIKSLARIAESALDD